MDRFITMNILQLKVSASLAVIFVCITGVDTLTFHRCRAGNTTGQYFTMNGCPAGQVINIQSAYAGYSQRYNPTATPPQCPWLNCTKSTTEPAQLCNGRRTCRIPQTILMYARGSSLCPLQRDGNFIRIQYSCVTGVIAGIAAAAVVLILILLASLGLCVYHRRTKSAPEYLSNNQTTDSVQDGYLRPQPSIDYLVSRQPDSMSHVSRKPTTVSESASYVYCYATPPSINTERSHRSRVPNDASNNQTTDIDQDGYLRPQPTIDYLVSRQPDSMSPVSREPTTVSESASSDYCYATQPVINTRLN